MVLVGKFLDYIFGFNYCVGQNQQSTLSSGQDHPGQMIWRGVFVPANRPDQIRILLLLIRPHLMKERGRRRKALILEELENNKPRSAAVSAAVSRQPFAIRNRSYGGFCLNNSIRRTFGYDGSIPYSRHSFTYSDSREVLHLLCAPEVGILLFVWELTQMFFSNI